MDVCIYIICRYMETSFGTGIMNGSQRGILQCIGNTSLLALRNIVPGNGSRILLKMENENPTGSMKDRMALAMIEAAEADGRLTADGSVVEYTGGSTGVSLSLVCAVKGYPLHIVTSDAFARQKLDHMKILGARLQIVRSDGGRMTEKLTRDMIEAARIIAGETGGFWTDQLNNRDQLAAYHGMAEEIWAQTGGRIDGFVQSVGTAASLRGTAEALRRRTERIRIVAVEPAESPVLSGGQAGAHKIDGIGAGFVVPLWQAGLADRIERVSTDDAVAMALRLAREEGLFAGTSTGANVVAALRLAEQLGPGAAIVTVMCDTGMKYLKAYADKVGAAHGPSPPPAMPDARRAKA
jgi:cysteine synthase A